MNLWIKIPAFIRGPVIGILVLLVGIQPISVLVSLNLAWLPSLPWSILPSGLYLYCFWKYLGGWWLPRSNQAVRELLLRAFRIERSIYRPLLIATASLTLGIISISVLSYGAREIPPEQLGLLMAILELSPLAAICLIVLVAVFSGVIEEAAFRGYMQGIMEKAYHPAIAIVITAALFAVVHPQPPLFLIFFTLGACGWGILAYVGGTIIPLVIAHALIDFSFLVWAYLNPVQFQNLLAYNFVSDGLTGTLLVWALLATLAAIVFVASVMQVRRIKAPDQQLQPGDSRHAN